MNFFARFFKKKKQQEYKTVKVYPLDPDVQEEITRLGEAHYYDPEFSETRRSTPHVDAIRIIGATVLRRQNIRRMLLNRGGGR